jgi:hypothetical protein
MSDLMVYLFLLAITLGGSTVIILWFVLNI